MKACSGFGFVRTKRKGLRRNNWMGTGDGSLKTLGDRGEGLLGPWKAVVGNISRLFYM